jgi:hypothetical protein
VGKQVLVVSRLTVDTILEDRDHVLLGQLVKMMDLVASIDDIRHHIGRRSVDNGRRDNIRHISGILMLGQSKARLRVELADSREMNIATDMGCQNDSNLGKCNRGLT